VIIERSEFERRLLAGLHERLMAPELVAAFIAEYQAELRRATQAADGEHASKSGRFAVAAVEPRRVSADTELSD
jgi:hypothetical protein